MRILITGGSGQVGTELLRILRDMRSETNVLPKDYQNSSVDAPLHEELDLTSFASIDNWMTNHKSYDLIINSAALTDVDYCELHEAEALRLNAMAVDRLALYAQSQNTKLVQLSTDQIYKYNECFDYLEESAPAMPVNAYGRSKLAGEVFAREDCNKSFIVRTSWVFGYKGNNFVKAIIRCAKETGKISVVGDQISNPTSANDLADAILRLAVTENYGTYNFTNRPYCTKFEFAKKITTTLRIKCEKEELSTEEFIKRNPNSAPRPKHTILAPWNTEHVLGYIARDWETALKQYLKNLPKLGED